MLPNSTKIKIKDEEFDLLLSEQQILERIQEVANEISKDYADKNPLLIGVLNGSFVFSADLIRMMSINSEISFVRMASYDGVRSSGEVKQVLGLSENIFGRHIIIVEDIVDTGFTMESILDHFVDRGAKSVEVCSLLVKPQSLKRKIDIKYKCFDIGDDFVVGYGLDYDGQGRNLKEIYQLPPKQG